MPDAVAAAPAAGTAPPAPAAAETTGTTTPGVAGTTAPVVAADVAKQDTKTDATKYKVKIDGVEKEVSLDELQKGYQLESAARKRMQEASEVLSAFEKNPREAIDRVLKDKKTSLRDLAIQVLSEEHNAILDEERRKAMDPAQREIEDKLKERDQLLDEKKKTEEGTRAAQVQQQKQILAKSVIDTLQEFPESLRQNEALAHNVFEAWAYCKQHPEEAKELGIEPTPKGIASALRKRHLEIAKAMVDSANDDEQMAIVTEALAGKILAKKKAAAEAAAHPSLTSTPKVRGEEKKGDAPRRSQGAKLRELTLGSLGIKG